MKRINPLFALGTIGLAAVLGTTQAMAQGAQSPHPAMSTASPSAQVVRGLYLVRISGCNDCHTPGYAESGGQPPQSAWLTGNPVGFRGPWGTTYAGNLRLAFRHLGESDWLRRARQPQRPPMPWFALRDMSEDDLRALYAAVRYLGPAGDPAPAYVPAGRVPTGLFIEFVPRSASPRQAVQKP
jgi:mono/diheme cytochrome c family protein